jgi:hypothetical protein
MFVYVPGPAVGFGRSVVVCVGEAVGAGDDVEADSDAKGDADGVRTDPLGVHADRTHSAATNRILIEDPNYLSAFR